MIYLEYWQVAHMLGKYDMEVKLGNHTYRFFAKDKDQGYAITKQMEYEGEWRVLHVSNARRLQNS